MVRVHRECISALKDSNCQEQGDSANPSLPHEMAMAGPAEENDGAEPNENSGGRPWDREI
jgi:hypothetical protein